MKSAILSMLLLLYLASCVAPVGKELLPNEPVVIQVTEPDGSTPLVHFRGARLGAPLSDFPGLHYDSGQGDAIACTLPAASPLPLGRGPGTVSRLFFRGRLTRVMVHTRTQAERRQLLAELSRVYGPPSATADSNKMQSWSSSYLDVTYYPDEKHAQADAWVLSPALAQQWETAQGQAARAQQRKP